MNAVFFICQPLISETWKTEIPINPNMLFNKCLKNVEKKETYLLYIKNYNIARSLLSSEYLIDLINHAV